MKCIRCGTDSKYKDRVGKGTCLQCGEKFAFEPKTDRYTVSDGLFQRVIADVSAKDKLLFTERQLYYEFCRRALKRRTPPRLAGGIVIGILSTVGSIAVAGIFESFFPLVIGACGIATGVAVARSKESKAPTPLAPLTFDEFRSKYLTPWQQAHGEIEKLMKASTLSKVDGDAPRDLSAYSFDRAVVTGSRDMAAMLVANRFHFENNCAILSLDGYPEHAFDTVMSMLKRNPNLTVFAVHSASSAGMRLASHLREDHWFPDRAVRVVDLGLRPSHAIKMKMIALQDTPQPAQPGLPSTLTPEEIRWLDSGLFVELAALRPARLMKAIYQGFARANRDLSSTTDTDGDVWIADPTVDVYASDSFG